MKKLLWLAIVIVSIQNPIHAADNIAANAINTLGIDLLRQTKPDQNTVLSAYSIQSAMAMAYEGADGTTRTEMAKVLHYANGDKVRESIRDVREQLEGLSRQNGTDADQCTLATANRLFGQTGYDFRPTYLSLLKDSYAAPFEALDFATQPANAANHINSWVEQQTRQKIRDLISPSALNALTRLVLVNAVYFKATWREQFEPNATTSEPFYVSKNQTNRVYMMQQTAKLVGYKKFNKMTALVLPYIPSNLQFVILLPDSRDGLEALQQNISSELLAECANLEHKKVVLHLPKFRLEPPVIDLKSNFEILGMKQPFDVPTGSANFDRIAPRRGTDYLYISDIFHKTFVDVNEQGTEAAAATAVIWMTNGVDLEQPPEVYIDHPFLFAIQHRETGACLFLGRVVDPSKN